MSKLPKSLSKKKKWLLWLWCDMFRFSNIVMLRTRLLTHKALGTHSTHIQALAGRALRAKVGGKHTNRKWQKESFAELWTSCLFASVLGWGSLLKMQCVLSELLAEDATALAGRSHVLHQDSGLQLPPFY